MSWNESRSLNAVNRDRSPRELRGSITHAESARRDSPEGQHKRQLLFLCQTLPYPPHGGVLIRTYNVLRLLSREFDITAMCFFRAAERTSPTEVRESLENLSSLCRVEAFQIPQEHSKVRLVFDHLRSLVRRKAYTVYAYESSDFRERLRELLATREFDLVHVDSLDLSGYLPVLHGLPIICVHHNVESKLLARRAAGTGGFFGKYLALQARLTEAEEQRWCRSVSLNIAVSVNDRADLLTVAPGSQCVVVPNGVDTQAFQPGTTSHQGIVFVGTYSWHPNRDAMEYFCSEVLPRIRERGIKDSVIWIGRAPAAVRRDYADRFGVELTGYLPDIRPLVQGAACYIAPLRTGGGTRLKILDAWAMGKAVVSTTVGCEGLDSRDGENILIRDTPDAFAEAVGAVMGDPELRNQLGRNARHTVEQSYDWEVIGHPMLAHYRRIIEPAGLQSPERER